MALLNIVRLGHPAIRGGAEPVTPEELARQEIRKLIDDMIDTMRDADGVGIAAPQVDVNKQIIVIEVESDNPRYPERGNVPLTVIINPEILNPSREKELGWEGCLSIPGLRGVVPRHRALEVKGLDREGKPVHYHAEGFFARVIQHEVDHLNGNVYLDAMPDMQTLTHLQEFERYWLES